MSPVVLVTAVAPAVWGSTYVVTTTLLPDGRPLLAGVLRALPAGLLLLAVTRRLPQGSWWWRSAVLGTLNIGAFFALLFVSAYRLPGGVAAVLGAVGPLLVLALGVGAARRAGDPPRGGERRRRGCRGRAHRPDRSRPPRRLGRGRRPRRRRLDGARHRPHPAVGTSRPPR